MIMIFHDLPRSSLFATVSQRPLFFYRLFMLYVCRLNVKDIIRIVVYMNIIYYALLYSAENSVSIQ